MAFRTISTAEALRYLSSSESGKACNSIVDRSSISNTYGFGVSQELNTAMQHKFNLTSIRISQLPFLSLSAFLLPLLTLI